MKDVDGLSKRSNTSFSSRVDEKLSYADELYSIKNDPDQKNNLYEQKPGIVKEMRKQYIAFLRELGTDPEYMGAWES